MYPGFVLIRYGKTYSHGNDRHEGKDFYIHRSLKLKAWHATQGNKKKQQGWSENGGSEGKMGEPSWWFPWET